MPRNLIIAGGPSHSFEETAALLAAQFELGGFACDVVFDIEVGLQQLAHCDYDLLTVHALRWTMKQHQKYELQRPRWAFSLSEAGKAEIRGHIAGGGGIVGLHTACICFDDWPEWRDILGVGWEWGRSHHPPLTELEVHVTDPSHPVSRGIADFGVVDELYSDLAIAPGVEILAMAKVADSDRWQPAAFAFEKAGSRRFYLSLGHDVESLSVPSARTMIVQAARWAARLPLAAATEASEASS